MPVAANDDVNQAIPLTPRVVSTVSNVGLTSAGADQGYSIYDGKTAWWSFTTGTEGWYIFDATESGDGSATTQAKLSGEVYRFTDYNRTRMAVGDTITDWFSFVDGFYLQNPAWIAVYCYTDSTYYFVVDSQNYSGTYAARVRPGKKGALVVPPTVTISHTVTPDQPNYSTNQAEIGGAIAYITTYASRWTNSTPTGVTGKTPSVLWDAVRGSGSTTYSPSVTRSGVGATAATRWPFSYFREGLDSGAMTWRVQYTFFQLQLLAYEIRTVDTLPDGAAGISYQDGVPGKINNISVTANVLNQVDSSTGNPWPGTDTVHIDRQYYSSSSYYSPAGNMPVGPLENRTIYVPDPAYGSSVSSGTNPYVLNNQFIVIAPTRVADPTPLAEVATSPYQNWMSGEMTLTVSYDHVPRPYYPIFVDDGTGGLTGSQSSLQTGGDVESVGRAQFW